METPKCSIDYLNTRKTIIKKNSRYDGNLSNANGECYEEIVEKTNEQIALKKSECLALWHYERYNFKKDVMICVQIKI